MKFRHLDNSEISTLRNQDCDSSDWKQIRVSDKFSPGRVQNVRFAGEVKIGEVSGLYHSKISNCEIGDDVLIDEVHLIQNYRIMDHVTLENVDAISVNGATSFGNGFELEVLNEGGGRE